MNIPQPSTSGREGRAPSPHAPAPAAYAPPGEPLSGSSVASPWHPGIGRLHRTGPEGNIDHETEDGILK